MANMRQVGAVVEVIELLPVPDVAEISTVFVDDLEMEVIFIDEEVEYVVLH